MTATGANPLRYQRITQPFGNPGKYASSADRHGPSGHHTGIDFGRALQFATLLSAKVRSATAGEVVISDYNDTMGNWVGVYYSADDVTITYWHLKSRKVRVGQRVVEGQMLGRVGSTGNSSAAHLHVQVNPGRGFNYNAHIPPAPWVRGPYAREEKGRAVPMPLTTDPAERAAALDIIAAEGFEVEAPPI